jgi:hypothetical protein
VIVVALRWGKRTTSSAREQSVRGEAHSRPARRRCPRSSRRLLERRTSGRRSIHCSPLPPPLCPLPRYPPPSRFRSTNPFPVFPLFCPMSTPARRRLMRDFKRLQNDPPTGISGAPMEVCSWGSRGGCAFRLLTRFSCLTSHPVSSCVCLERYPSVGRYERRHVDVGLRTPSAQLTLVLLSSSPPTHSPAAVAVIFGPEETPWEDGTFTACVQLAVPRPFYTLDN